MSVRRAVKTPFICGVVIVACAVLCSTSFAQLNDLRASVRFRHGKFVIENLGTNTWRHCALYINLDEADGGYDSHLDLLEPGQATAIDAKQFTMPTGERYNAAKTPPVLIRIVCHDDDGRAVSALETPVQ